jgi:hypothetical protein
VSAASDAADVSEEAAVTEQTEDTVSEATASVDATAHPPVIQVLKGQPTDEDLAALVTVFAGASGGPVDTGPPERDMWGHPVDKLRYAIFSWQRVTQVERTHVRR